MQPVETGKELVATVSALPREKRIGEGFGMGCLK
jgi:hypothetical protein